MREAFAPSPLFHPVKLRPDTLAFTLVLALLATFGPFSTDMYLPSLPDIARLFGASTAETQLTLSAYLIGFAVAQVVYGPISDRHGRRPVLLAALLLYTLASFACAVAPSIPALIAARFAQACGGAGAIVLARAMIRDLYSGARAGREMSLMSAIMALAPIAAPLIGGLLQAAFGWKANFLALMAFGLVCTLVIWLLLPETLVHRLREPLSLRGIVRSYGVMIRNGAFAGNLTLVVLSYAGLLTWISGASFVLQDLYHLSPAEFGIAFGLSGSGYVVGTSIAAHLVMRIGLERLIGVGTLLLALGGWVACIGLFSGTTANVLLVAPMWLYLVGMGLVFPQAVAGSLVPFPQQAGTAASLVGLVQQGVAAALGFGITALLTTTPWPMVGGIAVLGTAALAIWIFTRQPRTAA